MVSVLALSFLLAPQPASSSKEELIVNLYLEARKRIEGKEKVILRKGMVELHIFSQSNDATLIIIPLPRYRANLAVVRGFHVTREKIFAKFHQNLQILSEGRVYSGPDPHPMSGPEEEVGIEMLEMLASTLRLAEEIFPSKNKMEF
jgi:hypothetical protein